MARYRKVDPRIWNDAKFRELSDNGKLVFFMLLTHPNMTALGAMRGTIAGLAEEIGWTSEAFAEAFREAYEKGMTEHDPKACLIALPRFIKYNQPESPNVVKAWVGARDLLPECELKNRVVSRAGEYAKDMSKSFSEAFAKAFVKTMPYQEPEPDPEPKSTTTTSSAPGVKDDNSSPFRMTLSWEPVKPLLHERCRQAGIDLDNLPEGELADVLGEFRSYWEGRSDMLTERQSVALRDNVV